MAAFLQFLILFSVSVTIILAICISPDCDSGDQKYTNDTLAEKYGSPIFIWTFCRHGSRTPIMFYPNDNNSSPEIQKKCWPDGPGQLTEKGKCQMHEQGEWAKKHYSNLFTGICRWDYGEMQCTNTDRTILSALYFLLGFCTVAMEMRVSCDKTDNMIEFNAKCNEYDKEKSQFAKSPEIRSLYDKYQKCFEIANNHTGWNMTKENAVHAFDYFYYMCDTWAYQKECNLTRPDWAKDVYHCCNAIGNQAMKNRVYTEKMKQLRLGALMYKMRTEMDSKIQGKKGDPEYMRNILCHDLTQVCIMAGLEIDYGNILPSLGSCLFFQLRKKDDKHTLTIEYRNSTNSPPYLFKVPGCEEACPWDKFKNVTAHLVTENWNEACGNDESCSCIDEP